jgi:hypothetical protein
MLIFVGGPLAFVASCSVLSLTKAVKAPPAFRPVFITVLVAALVVAIPAFWYFIAKLIESRRK